MSTESARRILFKDFGGKKAMKVLERKEKMKINVDVVKDQLDKTLLGNIECNIALSCESGRALTYPGVLFLYHRRSRY